MTIVSGCQRGRPRNSRQQRRRIVLDEHLRLEIEPGAEAEILVRRPGIAIRAAVRAAAIGIEAVAERDVGAVVFRDDRFEESSRYSVGGRSRRCRSNSSSNSNCSRSRSACTRSKRFGGLI